jgi:hypothetical protein
VVESAALEHANLRELADLSLAYKLVISFFIYLVALHYSDGVRDAMKGTAASVATKGNFVKHGSLGIDTR